MKFMSLGRAASRHAARWSSRRTSHRTSLCALVALSFAALLPGIASAQDSAWPNKLLSYIVPFTAGGSTDVIGRTVAQKLAEVLKQPVVVDNKPGAAGAVGAAYVAKAKPDGYTLFGGTISTHAINAGLYKNLPYDPVRDFEMASGQAIYAPKGTPVPIVARLHAEIVKILKGAEGGKLARQFGMEIVAGTPAQLAAHMAKEIPRWAALVKKSGATAD